MCASAMYTFISFMQLFVTLYAFKLQFRDYMKKFSLFLNENDNLQKKDCSILLVYVLLITGSNSWAFVTSKTHATIDDLQQI